jgi:uncharacterized protein YtpQ (UPF0354 family)
MDAMGHLREARENYLRQFRAAIRDLRAKDSECAAEVWVESGPDAAKHDLPDRLCFDLLGHDEEGKPQAIHVSSGEAPEGGLAGTIRAGDAVDAQVFALAWDVCFVWARIGSPDWSGLEPWRKKWLDPQRGADPSDEDGLSGVTHYLALPPVAEGGGHLFEMDLGSAPVEALTEFLEALAGMGATEVEVGRSDGSHLDHEIVRLIESPNLSQPQLTELFARLLRGLPETAEANVTGVDEIEVKGTKGSSAHKVYTGNLYQRLMRVGREARVKEVYRYLRGQRETMVETTAGDLSQLRPVIKDDRFFEMLGRAGKDMKPLVARRLVGDIWVCCVWDMPNGMRFTTADEPEQYQLSADAVHARAVSNYLKDRGDVEFAEHGPLLVARTGDCYDATLLLDDAFWTETAEKVEGDPLVCVPARDVVLITGSQTRGGVEAIRDIAKKVSAGGDHLITETILRRVPGKWTVFEREAGGPSSAEPQRPPPPPRPSPATEIQPKPRPWWKFW